MFSADSISGSRDFTQHLTSGEFTDFDSFSWRLYLGVDCARVQRKTLSSLLNVFKSVRKIDARSRGRGA